MFLQKIEGSFVLPFSKEAVFAGNIHPLVKALEDVSYLLRFVIVSGTFTLLDLLSSILGCLSSFQ